MKNIKRTIGVISIMLFGLFTIQTTFISCTDIAGDGVDSIFYPGSSLPLNTSYRNPVWEPDFELGVVFKGAVSYTAIASEVQWTKGITSCGPVLASTNLMDWTFNNNRTAFPLKPDTVVLGTETTIYNRPSWAEGRIHSMAAGFARTIATYWLFYQIGDTPAIGVAYAKTPQGPYVDLGKLLDANTTGTASITDPFFIVVGTRFYLLYSTDSGSYAQELTLVSTRTRTEATLRNNPTKVTNENFKDVAVFRKGSYYYIFGTVKNNEKTQINYARSGAITGPYVDKDGTSLLTGNGMQIIESGEQLQNPQNVCGIFSDFYETDFIMYTVTDSKIPTLVSGFNRRPLMLNKLETTQDNWFEGLITPKLGWTSPRFIDKE